MAKINAKWAERHGHTLAPRRRGPDVLLLGSRDGYPDRRSTLWTALEAAGVDVHRQTDTLLCEACDGPTHNEDAASFDDTSWLCLSCYDYRACHGREGRPCEGGYNGGPAEADDEGGHVCAGCAWLKIEDVDAGSSPNLDEVAKHLGVCEEWAGRIWRRLGGQLGRHIAPLYRAVANIGFDAAQHPHKLDAEEVQAVRDFIRALADGYPSEAGFAPDAYRALGWAEEEDEEPEPAPAIDWQPCAQPSIENDGGDAARAAFWGEEA